MLTGPFDDKMFHDADSVACFEGEGEGMGWIVRSWAHFLLRKKPGFAGVPPLARPFNPLRNKL
jgi:hypothetical protein